MVAESVICIVGYEIETSISLDGFKPHSRRQLKTNSISKVSKKARTALGIEITTIQFTYSCFADTGSLQASW